MTTQRRALRDTGIQAYLMIGKFIKKEWTICWAVSVDSTKGDYNGAGAHNGQAMDGVIEGSLLTSLSWHSRKSELSLGKFVLIISICRYLYSGPDPLYSPAVLYSPDGKFLSSRREFSWATIRTKEGNEQR